jgi:hypothetical protein
MSLRSAKKIHRRKMDANIFVGPFAQAGPWRSKRLLVIFYPSGVVAEVPRLCCLIIISYLTIQVAH